MIAQQALDTAQRLLDMMAPSKDQFFNERSGRALTFNDVRIVLGHADFLPGETDIRSRFSRRVPVLFPLVPAAMDTITESPMAIEFAMHGGVGVIHKNLSVERQVEEVRRTKDHYQRRIDTPVCVKDADTFGDVRILIAEKTLHFKSFPVLDENGVLVGLITSKHFNLAESIDTRVRDQMIPYSRLLTAPPDTSPETALELMRKTGKHVLPLVEEGRDNEPRLVGLYTLKSVTPQPMYNLDKDYRLRVAASIGVGPGSFERALALADAKVDAIVIDTAHGNTKSVIELVKRLKAAVRLADVDIVAGNVVEPMGAVMLALAGADAIKVGVGGGSICTTRVETGVGIPQVTAVYWCVRALRECGFDIPVISDGAVVNYGDPCLAFVSGAECVMVGGLIAATDETPGEVIERNGRKYKRYRGMGSASALREHAESRDRYRLSQTTNRALAPEGVEKEIACRGPVRAILETQEQYLRSSLGYAGTRTITEFRLNSRLVEITSGGLLESHPHSTQNETGGDSR